MRAGFRIRLGSALSNVHVYPSPPDTVNAPAVVVGSVKRSGRETFDPTNKVSVELLCVVSRRSTDQYATLDAMCEPSGSLSIQAAIEADGTLGGNVSDVTVVEVEQAGAVDIDGVSYYAAVITAEVWL